MLRYVLSHAAPVAREGEDPERMNGALEELEAERFHFSISVTGPSVTRRMIAPSTQPLAISF
jgi:hypothetical protein